MNRTVLIIGAGRVGLSCYTLISTYTSYKALIADPSTEALDRAAANGAAFNLRREDGAAAVRSVKPWAVICAGPFTVNVEVAKAAAEVGAHYIDFTEDVGVTKEIMALSHDGIFIPQTGLAPGLITSIGAVLVDYLAGREEVQELNLRVGALPQFSNHPASYALTWSSLGLANEYIKPAEIIRNGKVETVASLGQLEKLVIGGATYEAFTTSGGMGPASIYRVPNVDYKTIRYPGHLDWLIGPLGAIKQAAWPEPLPPKLDKLTELFEREFKHTRQDRVVVFARAATATREVCYAHIFEPESSAFTALELTTAGTGVACLEYIAMLERNSVKGRTIFGGQVSYADLLNTSVGRSFLTRIEL